MPDWTKSMQQTYEHYIVDPATWGDMERLDTIESCTITRDAETDTLGSASLKCMDDQSDKYIRTYLITIQNGLRERFPLGTHIYQSPSSTYDGHRRSSDQDGYTPLIELKEKVPPLGYAILKGQNILDLASRLVEENVRAPVVYGESDDTLIENFVSDINDNWLTFTKDLIANAKHGYDIDEMGRILFSRNQELSSLQSRWIFTDDNSSILYPEITLKRDLYGVPNVVEVIYSPANSAPLVSRAVNNDPASEVSTVSRGREVVYRESDPDVAEGLTQLQLDEYAKNLLKEMSSLEYEISYSHGYCPVRVGDCVTLNYRSAGIDMVNAKVTRQVIKCESGCPVEETAVFTKQLWG